MTSVTNRITKGDERGKYTYVEPRSETIIDYVMGEVGIEDRLESLSIREEVDSDHHPLIITLKDRAERRRREKGGKRGQARDEWNERGRGKFR